MISKPVTVQCGGITLVIGECSHEKEQVNHGPTTDQINHWCPDCRTSWTTFPPRPVTPRDRIQPTYYVRHPDDTYSAADPQPTRGAQATSVDWLGLSLDMEAQAKRPDERPGYKLVPVEPDESMMHAGARSQGATVYYKEVLAIYRAMLDAAPAAADAKQVPRTAPAYRQIGWTIDTGSGRLFESNVTEEQRTRWQPVYITAVEASGEALPEGCEHGMRWDRQCSACAGVDRK